MVVLPRAPPRAHYDIVGDGVGCLGWSDKKERKETRRPSSLETRKQAPPPLMTSGVFHLYKIHTSRVLTLKNIKRQPVCSSYCWEQSVGYWCVYKNKCSLKHDTFCFSSNSRRGGGGGGHQRSEK